VHLIGRILKKDRGEISAGWKSKTKSGFTQSCCRISVQMYSFQSVFRKMLTSAFFWDIMQCIVVISYKRFGTTYRSQLQWSRIPSGPLKMGLKFCPWMSIWDYDYRCVISQKSVDLIYFEVETWNHVLKKIY
jgi:hypothetical protein